MTSMQESNSTGLVFDLAEWISKEPRTYAQTIDAWRTSCPRLTVWEEVQGRGHVVRDIAGVRVTEAGRRFLPRKQTNVPSRA
jgi:hypothetical protein